MIVTDFVYDGVALSNLGYMISDLDSSNNVSESENATRTFNNISMFNGKYMPFTASIYENRIEFTFDIIKNTCKGINDYRITNMEVQHIMRWLARPDNHEIKFVHSDYSYVYYEGSFNVSNLKLGDDIVGLRLNFVTTRPFGVHETVWFRQELDSPDDELLVTDISDDAGHVYPYIEILCKESGNLCLTNSYDGVSTIINNCSEGERIIFTENLILSTDQIDHKIQNDFNYEFLRISNNYTNRTNRITSTLKCEILLSYNPIAKVVY